MSRDFVKIIPQRVAVPPVIDLDIDAPRSLALFDRPQKAQEIGWFDPAILLQHRLDGPLSIPVKGPGTAVYAPDMGLTELYQCMADYRVSTSSRADGEWWHLIYDQTDVQRNHPARLTEGKHVDDPDERFIDGRGRVTGGFLIVSHFPTIWYEGIRNLQGEPYRSASETWNRLADSGDQYEAGEVRNAFYNGLAYPPKGYTRPPGTLMFATGAVLHETPIADAHARRGFLTQRCYESSVMPYKPAEVMRLNPPLAKALALAG